MSKLPATGPYNRWGVEVLSGPLAGTTRSNVSAQQRVISGDYLKAVGIRVLEGRAFDARDLPPAPRRVLVSKSLATKLFPGVDPIGQTIAPDSGRPCEIIGVVSDVSLDAEGNIDDYVYHAHVQFAGDRNWALAQVVATTKAPESMEADVRRVLASIDPQLVMHHPTPLDEAIGRGEAQRVFTLRLLASFAVLSLGLAALGLFGVLSYGVRLRTREIGIRVALGAQTRRHPADGAASGNVDDGPGDGGRSGGALATSRVMASMLFHVPSADPTILAGSAFAWRLWRRSRRTCLPGARRASIRGRRCNSGGTGGRVATASIRRRTAMRCSRAACRVARFSRRRARYGHGSVDLRRPV